MTEFDFIDRIRMAFATLPDHGFEGIGDDCAVLPIGNGESLVFTTDMLCEDVHFLRADITARELGHKSLAVNLSDVAAMGARPVATLLSVALPEEVSLDWADEFMEGYRALSEEFGVALVGGDTTRSKSGITINVMAIGRAEEGRIKRRNAAQVGDIIFVADQLGASGAGLQAILKGDRGTPLAALHRMPCPQVREGIWLGKRREVHAMMDLSDGLASDLKHILDRSHVGAVVDLERIPVAEGADLQGAACAGEDYKLLFTVAEDYAALLAADFQAHFAAPLYPIGRITANGGLCWMRGGTPETLNWRGFQHF